MPHTKCKEVYYFDELSETAKEAARDWFRRDYPDSDWWDGVYDTIQDAGKYLGIEFEKKPVKLMGGGTRYDPCIYFSGFYSQGDGASFLGTWRSENMQTLAKLQADFSTDAELARLHTELWKVKTEYPEAIITSTRSHCRYSHERSTNLEAILGEEIDYSKDTHQPIEELLVEFMQWMYTQLRKEYDYLTSNEHVDETIQLNEYEFTQEGRIA